MVSSSRVRRVILPPPPPPPFHNARCATGKKNKLQDKHECRRTFLFAPYALVRSNSMWKQRGWHQPQHSSPNVWCRLHCETATERLPTGMSNNNYALGESAAGIISPISQTATEHLPNAAILCEDCDEADHSVLCHATGHAHMVSPRLLPHGVQGGVNPP